MNVYIDAMFKIIDDATHSGSIILLDRKCIPHWLKWYGYIGKCEIPLLAIVFPYAGIIMRTGTNM